MDTIGPYRLLEVLADRHDGKVWRAADARGSVATVAVLAENADEARSAAFRDSANPPGRNQVLARDLSCATPWVAFVDDGGQRANVLFDKIEETPAADGAATEPPRLPSSPGADSPTAPAASTPDATPVNATTGGVSPSAPGTPPSPHASDVESSIGAHTVLMRPAAADSAPLPRPQFTYDAPAAQVPPDAHVPPAAPDSPVSPVSPVYGAPYSGLPAYGSQDPHAPTSSPGPQPPAQLPNAAPPPFAPPPASPPPPFAPPPASPPPPPFAPPPHDGPQPQPQQAYSAPTQPGPLYSAPPAPYSVQPHPGSAYSVTPAQPPFGEPPQQPPQPAPPAQYSAPPAQPPFSAPPQQPALPGPYSAQPYTAQPHPGPPHPASPYSAAPYSAAPYSATPYSVQAAQQPYSAPPANSAPPWQQSDAQGWQQPMQPPHEPPPPITAPDYDDEPRGLRSPKVIAVLVAVIALMLGGGGAAIWAATQGEPDRKSTAAPSPSASSSASTSTSTSSAPTKASDVMPPVPGGEPGQEPPSAAEDPDWPEFGDAEHVSTLKNLDGVGFDLVLPEGWQCVLTQKSDTAVRHACGGRTAGIEIGGHLRIRKCSSPCDAKRRPELRKKENAWGLRWRRIDDYTVFVETQTLRDAEGKERYGIVLVRYFHDGKGRPLNKQLVLRMTAPPDRADDLRKIANSLLTKVS